MARVDMDTAGLVMLALAEVPQVMSAFLPSPATARMGFNEGEDAALRIEYLRRGEKIGSAVSMGIAVSISLITRPRLGNSAWLVTIGAGAVLAIFLWEYERALTAAQDEHAGG